MSYSIRRRLLLTLLSITVAIWSVTAITSYFDARHEIGELFDAQLAVSARTLLTVAGHELEELAGGPIDNAHIHFTADNPLLTGGHKYEHKLAYQLWQQPEDTLLLRSFNAPERHLAANTDGYSDEVLDGQRWRIFSLSDPLSGFQVQVGEAIGIREELTDYIALRIGSPIVVALPVLALLIYFGIGRSLQPLRRLAQAVFRREPGNLETIDAGDAPSEIHPLVSALNGLFQRLRQAFEIERRFTADAAHELRTPLAALKIQAQVALRSQDSAEREAAIGKMLQGVDRASRLVEQLLTLARVDPDAGMAVGGTVLLQPLAEEVIGDHESQARAKEISLQLKAEHGLSVRGQRESLAILLRNLLDNAIHYTPRGGSIEVSLTRENVDVTLRINDSGPGIPDVERERIFGRFVRLAGQETGGSGLGLSIVRRIAELHRAELHLGESALGGLEVCVRFPNAEA